MPVRPIKSVRPTHSQLEEAYPLVCAYRTGILSEIWKELKAQISETEDFPVTAGCIAAAKLAAQYGRERAALDAEVDTRARSGGLSDGEPIVELYDWLVDHDNFRREVVDLSGSRTLLEDIGEVAQECDVYPYK